MSAPARACPSCAGIWLYSLTFAHTTGCALGAADDATRAADADNLDSRLGYGYTRAATPTELAFADALGMPMPTARFGDVGTAPSAPTVFTNVIPRTGSITTRRLRIGDYGDVFDPDEPAQ